MLCPFKPVYERMKKMKILDKITLVLFSIIMLILSIISSLLVFGWIELVNIEKVVKMVINNQVASNITIACAGIFTLLAIKGIFFSGTKNKKDETMVDNKNGILLENADGKLFITRETIENLVSSTVKGFDSAEEVTTKIELTPDNNLLVFINMTVKENAIIKELSTNLQSKIKDSIKKATDLEVKEVNIKVRNIEPVKEIVQG